MPQAKPALAVLAVVSWLLLAVPSQAQITTTVDQQGKLVFINTDSRIGRNGSTISSPSKTAPADHGTPPARPAWPALPTPSAPVSEGGIEELAPAPPAGEEQPTQPEDRLDRMVREAAERNHLDPALVKAVISTESGWNPNAVSAKGAVGLMQLIPETAQRYGVNNSFDPAQNIEGGTRYLKSLLDRYDGDLTKSLAAYNAGERTVDLNGGVPAIPETRKYVQKVTNAYFQPGSHRNRNLWSPPKPPVRRQIDANGRVVFTNE